MNAITPITRRWDYASGALECQTCEGTGWLLSTPGHTHPNDPDRCDVECPDCKSAGHTACEVCGFDIVVPGYDCLPCAMTQEIPAHLLTADTAKHIGTAMAAAFEARVKAGFVF